MSVNTIRRVDYFYATIKDEPGKAYEILNQMADLGINLLALTVIPFGASTTQIAIFPEDSLELESLAKKAKLTLDGPHPAILVQGDDKVGALTNLHKILFMAGVNVYATTGISTGKGSFGYLIYVRPEAWEEATRVLDI